MSAGKEFYDRQVEYLAGPDIDGLIENQYHPDAILVGYDAQTMTPWQRSGHEELKAHFKAYMEHLGYIKLISTDMFAEIGDAIFFEATVEVAGGIANVYDVFTFKDGKAIRHFTGLKGFRPKEG